MRPPGGLPARLGRRARCLRLGAAAGTERRADGRLPGEAVPRRRRLPGAALRETAGGRPALKPVQPRLHRTLVGVGGGQQHARADQFQLQPGRGRAAHLGQAGVHQVRRAAQLGGAEGRCLGLHPLHDIAGGGDQPLLERVGHGGDDHQVPQPLQQVGDEAARVVPALDDPVDDLERRRAVAGGEGLDHGVEQRAVGVAEQRRRHGVRHALLGGAGQQLIHDGHRVTHGAGARPHCQRQHRVVDGDRLALAHLGQVVPQRAGRDEAERVMVRSRADRADDLLGLGRGEDELQVLRRLLDHLQQGVETRRGDHVRLVDDVDLVTTGGGSEEGLLAQVTGVVYAAVRGGVDLDHVDRAGAVAREVEAGPALAAGRRRRPLLAVQAAGEDAGARRLPAAPRATEQVRVVDPVVAQGLLQRLSDMLLPDDLREGLGAVAAIQGEGRHTPDDIGRRGHPVPPGARTRPDMRTPPTHPPEPSYPCCLPALGEFRKMAPREGLRPQYPMGPPGIEFASTLRSLVWFAAEDSPSGLGRTLGKRVGGNPSRVRISYPPPSLTGLNVGPHRSGGGALRRSLVSVLVSFISDITDLSSQATSSEQDSGARSPPGRVSLSPEWRTETPRELPFWPCTDPLRARSTPPGRCSHRYVQRINSCLVAERSGRRPA